MDDLRGRKKGQTIETYGHWLRPWVKHVQKEGLVPSSLNLKTYLDGKYTNQRTYKRVGAQIVLFHNTYVNSRIHLIAPVGKVIRDNRV